MTDDPLLPAFVRFGEELARRAAAYVRSGEDAGVLDALGRIDRSGEARHESWLKPAEDRAALDACATSPDCLRRLGCVWVAADRPRTFVAELAGDAAWVETVVWVATSVSPQSSTRVTTALHADVLAQAMAAGGLDPETIVSIVCRRVADAAPPEKVFARRNFTDALLAMPGMGDLVVRHAAIVSEALTRSSAAARVEIVANLRAASTPPATFVPVLAPLAVVSQRTVASAAQAMLAGVPEAAREALRPFLDASSATERQGAIAALLALGQTDSAPFEARLAVETSAPVREALEAAVASRRAPPAEVAAPARDPVPPLGEEAFRLLRACADAWHRDASAETRQRRAAYAAFRGDDPEPLGDDAIRDVLARLQEPEAWPLEVTGARAPIADAPWLEDPATLQTLASSPLLSLVHVARAVALGTRHTDRRMRLLDVALAPVRATRELDLVAVADACDLAGIDGRLVALAALTNGFAWGDEAVLPLLAARPEALEVALSLRVLEGVEVPTYWRSDVRKSALSFLARMPRVPKALAPGLLQLGLAGPRAERPLTQRAAQNADGWQAKVLAALADRSQDVRAEAARWAARARVPAAREAIGTAFAREKQELARAAMLDALDVLGEPLDRFVDRGRLATEATRLLAKHPGPTWLALAAVRWADTGEAVPEAIVRAWISAAHKAKSPAGSALLRAYGRWLDGSDREALALAVLRGFVARDTEPPREVTADAERRLREQAADWAGFMQTTENEAYAQLRASFLASPEGSAIADKGVLAVVASLGGRGVADEVGAYLRTWYGNRAAQCKALLQMLAHVDDPAAIQLLLATATRFRTAGIRAEAEAQVKALAERRDWTLDELGDRTLPTGGLDENGALALSYGARTFEAWLDDRLVLALRDEGGAALKALPEPRKDDDEAAAKAAKATLSRARKGVAAVIAAQTDRLRAAMCTQRAWRFADWSTYLAAHPIVSRLCARIVWLGRSDDDAPATAFRPMGDGSLTTVDHAELVLAPDARVSVAHALLVDADASAAWALHLDDFQVLPLFPQLTRPTFEPDAETARARSLETHRGHMLDTFVLGGGATRLGYTRGAAQDGGWFHDYRRTFPTAGLDAVLEFSGSPLPEQKRTVALHGLSFVTRGQGAIPLSQVPRVLLSECWADMAELAALGTGFDADWENKVAT